MDQNEFLYFFIGTEAELIKLFPVMHTLTKRGASYKIIVSGQNDITKSTVLAALNGGSVDLELSREENIQKSAAGLLKWFITTWNYAKKAIPDKYGAQQLARGTLVVHGDTVSTMMGALLGRKFGMHVAHVEAGLRSHNRFHPFPEEIDRVITSKQADFHFAPGDIACANLKNAKGTVVNTVYNTIVDSLAYSRSVSCKSDAVNQLIGSEYFIFVLHRQENLAQKALISQLLQLLVQQAQKMRCVFIMHKPTEVVLKEMNLFDTILENPNITILPRVEYFDFMKLLENSKFAVTDGGSNQEELSYMGKPCMIMRTHTERFDGLGKNAQLYEGDIHKIQEFFNTYYQYDYPPVTPDASPSDMIADVLWRTL